MITLTKQVEMLLKDTLRNVLETPEDAPIRDIVRKVRVLEQAAYALAKAQELDNLTRALDAADFGINFYWKELTEIAHDIRRETGRFIMENLPKMGTYHID